MSYMEHFLLHSLWGGKPKKATIWKTWLFGKARRRKPTPGLGVGDLPLSK